MPDYRGCLTSKIITAIHGLQELDVVTAEATAEFGSRGGWWSKPKKKNQRYLLELSREEVELLQRHIRDARRGLRGVLEMTRGGGG